MSVSKSKNLERKLDNFAKEAKNELNNVCGSSLWESLGFVFFDQLEDSEKIAKAKKRIDELERLIKFWNDSDHDESKIVNFSKNIENKVA